MKLRAVKVLCPMLIFIFLLLNLFELDSCAEAGEEGIRVPIIMYHQVKPCRSGKDSITPYEFEGDLKYLIENDFSAVGMNDLIEYVYTGKELPEKPVILSFDDGYYNNYVYVYPLLQKYNVKIVMSIIGISTDNFSAIPDNNVEYAHVTWDQINEMTASGLVEIQNHSYNLHKITRKRYGCKISDGEAFEHYERVLTDDIGGLQSKILEKTGSSPNTFVYPYGKYSDESDKIIKKLGFKATLTCDYGVNVVEKDTDSLFGLKRICRSHGVPLKKLMK